MLSNSMTNMARKISQEDIRAQQARFLRLTKETRRTKQVRIKNKEPVKQTPKANDRLENFEKTGTFGRKETTPKQLGPTVEEFEAENDLGYVPNEGEDWPNSNTQKKQTPLGRGKEQDDRGKLARQETNKDKPTPKNRQQVRDEDVEEQRRGN
jgi:hypothetical protein